MAGPCNECDPANGRLCAECSERMSARYHLEVELRRAADARAEREARQVELERWQDAMAREGMR